MPVKVLFRGVSLFRERNDCVEVLMPATPRAKGEGRRHHYSRIVVWEGAAGKHRHGKASPPRKWHEPLTGGVEVTFTAGSGKPACTVADTIKLHQCLSLTLKNDADLAKADVAVARVVLRGGAIRPASPSKYTDWRFNQDQAGEKGILTYEYEWSVPAASVKVLFNGGGERTLHDDELIMIGNRPHLKVDHWHPDHDMMHDTPCTAGMVRDVDFWWVYRLFRNPTAKPVPETKCPNHGAGASGPKGGGSPTCFMAWWA